MFSYEICEVLRTPFLQNISGGCFRLKQMICFQIIKCGYLTLIIRSSLPEVFRKNGIFENFVKFAGNYLCQCLFLNKAAGVRSASFLKNRLWNRRTI